MGYSNRSWWLGVWLLSCFNGLWANEPDLSHQEPIGDATEAIGFHPVGPKAGTTYMDVRHLGMLRLTQPPASNHSLHGLSALAWVAPLDELFALSDAGVLFVYRPRFKQGSLIGVQWLRSVPLLDKSGVPLKGVAADSEAMVWQPDPLAVEGTLLIGFERAPRIERFDLQGHYLETLSLPSKMAQVGTYGAKNKAIEALALLPDGRYVAGVERPLKSQQTFVPLFTATGIQWRYDLAPEPKCGLTALEHWRNDEYISIERCFERLTRPFVIHLRHVRLAANDSRAVVKDLAVWRSDETELLDNFEGLSYHQHNRFFMISDDNGNPWQSTLLSYIELL